MMATDVLTTQHKDVTYTNTQHEKVEKDSAVEESATLVTTNGENRKVSDGGGGGGKFTLGADSGSDILENLAFSLKHHAGDAAPDLQSDMEMYQVGGVPPVHWSGQPTGPGTGWSRGGSICGSGAEYSGQYMDSMPEWGGGWGGDEDAISDLLGIKRVDSRDVVYENKKKTTKVLGRYVMGDVLGEGSYAKVKEAIDSETLVRRAVKIMKKRKLRKIPNGEQNVEREINLLHELNHRNVMKLIEVLFNEEKGKIYMVLEYCCAVLKDMLDQTPEKKFPVWQSHDYFTQLLDGLEYLHSKGIIHKDIKPGNLLLDQAGVLKIADFGVCQQLDLFARDDTITTSQGTPAFQPPEVANGWESFSGYKIDVWSSGVTLFNFHTGLYPFEGDTIFKLFENIGRAELELPASITDRLLASLITSMLTKEPADRPDIREIKAHDWCRKRFPRTGSAVSAPPHGSDPLLSTTVLPYLENMHYPSPSGSQVGETDWSGGSLLPSFSAVEVTEHQDTLEEPVLTEQRSKSADHHRQLVRKKSKTTSCIKFKNGCKQQ